MAAVLTVYGKLLPGRVDPRLELKPMVSSFDGRRFGYMVLGGWCSKWSSTEVILVDAIAMKLYSNNR